MQEVEAGDTLTVGADLVPSVVAYPPVDVPGAGWLAGTTRDRMQPTVARVGERWRRDPWHYRRW